MGEKGYEGAGVREKMGYKNECFSKLEKYQKPTIFENWCAVSFMKENKTGTVSLVPI